MMVMSPIDSERRKLNTGAQL